MYRPSQFIGYYPEAKKYSLFSSRGWWLNRWPFLGWLETVLKLYGFLCAYYVPERTSLAPKWENVSFLLWRRIELLTCGICTLLVTLGIVDRIFYREVVSIIFIVLNNWAHWTVFLALYKGHYDRKSLLYFLAFMTLGDIVKLIFFKVHDFNIGSVAKAVLYYLTSLFVISYLLIIFLELYFNSVVSVGKHK
ncbi:uncharacterized protein Gasu_12650 [Galdieria sulphuraria]|uniref:Uncharacterized protein n=1 Tax=Galdieria sulphuraria TaxID=130081 RepID=M2X536_GALSU|nr:uncharacterized protein Gasu_12650 [Galdieria sulphuraria]EME31595.1 hypothetical protein Gasu_12650 [Galdieria sulphuraria]|eukprot:XP_005708115.1 hypothetical protein Gasu_12650 [Galdieria sulphuraria]